MATYYCQKCGKDRTVKLERLNADTFEYTARCESCGVRNWEASSRLSNTLDAMAKEAKKQARAAERLAQKQAEEAAEAERRKKY